MIIAQLPHIPAVGRALHEEFDRSCSESFDSRQILPFSRQSERLYEVNRFPIGTQSLPACRNEVYPSYMSKEHCGNVRRDLNDVFAAINDEQQAPICHKGC